MRTMEKGEQFPRNLADLLCCMAVSRNTIDIYTYDIHMVGV